MKINRINVENILGVRYIDVALSKPVTVFAGGNGQGKSSLHEAIRMALLGETPRVALKKEYAALVRDGAKSGHTSVELDGRECAVQFPSGKGSCLSAEEFPFLPFVLDPSLFARSDVNRRRACLFRLTGVSAAPEQVCKRLSARGIPAPQIEYILPLLRGGFPEAHQEAQAKARDARAAWRAVTGEAYGEKKAEGWQAPKPAVDAGALQAIEADVESTQKRIADISAELGTIRGRIEAAKQNSTRLAKLCDVAGQYAKRADLVSRAEAELNKFRGHVEQLRAKAGKPGTDKPLACPHCGGLVQLAGDELAAHDPTATLETSPVTVSKLREYEQSMTMLEKALANRRRDLAEADAAAKQLKEDESDAGEPTEHDIESREQQLVELKDYLRTLTTQRDKARDDAKAAQQADEKTKVAAVAHADAATWDALAKALAPDGIPGEMLAEALKPVNDRLRVSAQSTGWMQVSISAEMDITANGRPHALLSESEQWRTDAMLAEMISHLSGLCLLALDRFDVLEPAARPDLLNWMADLADADEIDSAILFGTTKAPPKLPEDTFAVHWIESGELKEIA